MNPFVMVFKALCCFWLACFCWVVFADRIPNIHPVFANSLWVHGLIAPILVGIEGLIIVGNIFNPEYWPHLLDFVLYFLLPHVVLLSIAFRIPPAWYRYWGFRQDD